MQTLPLDSYYLFGISLLVLRLSAVVTINVDSVLFSFSEEKENIRVHKINAK